MLKLPSVLLVVVILIAGCGASTAPPVTPAPITPAPSTAVPVTPVPVTPPSLSDGAYLWCTDATSGNISRVVDAAVRLGIIHGKITDAHDEAFTALWGTHRSAIEASPLWPEFVRACLAAYENR